MPHSGDVIEPAETSGLTAGETLDVLRREGPMTRAELGSRAGLSRATITERTDQLTAAGLVTEMLGRASRGRPPRRLAFNPAAGVVVAVDLDRFNARLAVTDLDARVVAEKVVAADVADGPDAVLAKIQSACRRLLQEAGIARRDLWGIAVGVPGPIDSETGRVVAPAGMPGWADVAVGDAIGARFRVPVVVDNDVRLTAIGETAQLVGSRTDLVVVKLSIGIGCAVVSGGAVLRGVHGAAGEIGHIRVTGSDRRCRCGNVGCLETVASGWALIDELRREGIDATSVTDVASAIASGEHRALAAAREAGAALGEVLGSVVNLLNPAAVIVCGTLAQAGEVLLTSLRAAVYHRITPLAARGFEIRTSSLGERAGVVGGAHLVLDRLLTPTAIDRLLSARRRQSA